MTVPVDLRQLRGAAVRASLCRHTSLADAVSTMGFVQYDPIRSPARAQDLILHQRVRGYRAGDLERGYRDLGLEEGYLHVYGAMSPQLRALVTPDDDCAPPGLAGDVLALVRERGTARPREIAAALGDHRATNAWGGLSAATTVALDELHRRWLVRVVHRDGGVKVYGPAPPVEAVPHHERVRHLIVHLARTLYPVTVTTLRTALGQLRRRGGVDTVAALDTLLTSGELDRATVSGVDYTWPAGAAPTDGGTPTGVRLLAPFDPVVWDRRRFEHLWGWEFRFEAYTPAPKRRLGYYAIPILHNDRMVGWAQCTTTPDGLTVTTSYANHRPTTARFTTGLDREITRLARMLSLPVGSVH